MNLQNGKKENRIRNRTCPSGSISNHNNDDEKEAYRALTIELEKKKTCAAVEWIEGPSSFDVVCGRGKPFQQHQGNQRLHKLVALYVERYSGAARHKKTEIASEIVQVIKMTGRFLKRSSKDETSWIKVSDEIAREKVSHALRGMVRKTKGSKKMSRDETEVAGPHFGKRHAPEANLPGPKKTKLSQIRDHHVPVAGQRSNFMIEPLGAPPRLGFPIQPNLAQLMMPITPLVQRELAIQQLLRARAGALSLDLTQIPLLQKEALFLPYEASHPRYWL